VSQNRLRWAIFSASVVSAVDNPDAYLLRALGRLLSEQGHEAIFFEERGNPAVRALLRRSGGRVLNDFRERHPWIDYRTVDPQSGVVLVEWLTRTLSTTDIALVQRDTPAEIARWVGRLTRPHLQTYLLDTGLNPSPTTEEIADREPESFSGVFVADDQSTRVYAELVPSDRIHRFGPLPDVARLAELAEDETRALASITEALVESVERAAAADRASARARRERREYQR
jgi:hypothetical protein